MSNLRFLFLLLFAFLTACSQETQSVENYPELPVFTLYAKDTTHVTEFVANIEAIRNVEIRNRVGGYLDRIFVDEGKMVAKGAPMFEINTEEYKVEVNIATSNLQVALAESQLAEVEVGRLLPLVEKKIISKTELDMAKAKLIAANAKVDEARSLQAKAMLRLSHTLIKAPFNGLVDRIPFKVGSLIQEGVLLTDISDLEYIYAYFNVSETQYLKYMKTQLSSKNLNDSEVSMILADGTLYEHKGVMETTDGQFDSSTGSLAFRARFANPHQVLKHGSTGKIHLTNQLKNVLMVPQKSVVSIQDKDYVFLVNEQNTLTMQPFVPKGRLGHFYLVKSGLKAGDRIVYEGIQNIKDGDKIISKPISEKDLR